MPEEQQADPPPPSFWDEEPPDEVKKYHEENFDVSYEDSSDVESIEDLELGYDGDAEPAYI